MHLSLHSYRNLTRMHAHHSLPAVPGLDLGATAVESVGISMFSEAPTPFVTLVATFGGPLAELTQV